MSVPQKRIELMVIGAQKAGTTSLLHYLREHPEINAHQGNEFSFFADDKAYNMGFDHAYNRFFNPKSGGLVAAKNVTICSAEKALERLKMHNPEIKLVFILRNPVSRAYSGYTMGKSQGWIDKPFEEVIQTVVENDTNSQLYQLFISLGLYAEQLKVIKTYFPASQLRIVLFEEFKSDPNRICKQIFEWIGVDSSFRPNLEKAHNKTTKTRSQRYSGIVNRLKKEGNPLKSAIRFVLPYAWYAKLGHGIERVNMAEAQYEPISKEHTEILEAHFGPKNKKLQMLLSTAEYEESIKLIGDLNAWFKPKQ